MKLDPTILGSYSMSQNIWDKFWATGSTKLDRYFSEHKGYWLFVAEILEVKDGKW